MMTSIEKTITISISSGNFRQHLLPEPDGEDDRNFIPDREEHTR
jgi:hypothetical protein